MLEPPQPETLGPRVHGRRGPVPQREDADLLGIWHCHGFRLDGGGALGAGGGHAGEAAGGGGAGGHRQLRFPPGLAADPPAGASLGSHPQSRFGGGAGHGTE
eukprot:4339935-Alexandrium_andersonii.AAC.1